MATQSKAYKFDYHLPEAKENPSFPDKYDMTLVSTMEQLESILASPFEYMSFDTETTGLDPTVDFLVGYSFCLNSQTGYYVPVHHLSDPSLGIRAVELIHKAMLRAKGVFMFNARFDMRIMEYAGFDMSKVPYLDVQICVWLADTNKKFPSLKWAARHFMGWNMTTFTETLGDNYNFHYIRPEDAYRYACADALSTYNLAGVTLKYFTDAGLAGKIDNMLIYPLMKYEDRPLPIDIKLLELQEVEGFERLKEMDREIFKHFGYQFLLNSPEQLSRALQSIGLHTNEFTKTGKMATGIQILERLYKENGHPVLKLLVDRSKLNKLVNSFVGPLKKQAAEHNGLMRFAYHNVVVPTGRLACGSEANNPYFAKINEQALPKPHPRDWYVHRREDIPDIQSDEIEIMDWVFSLTRPSECIIEGTDPHMNFRNAFVVDPGFYWVSVDFSAIELRIPASMSQEPVWVQAFNSGGDIHLQTALNIWGSENYNKELRKRAKIANFGILYGTTAQSFAPRADMSLEEAEEFIVQYKKSLSTLFGWADRLCRVGRKQGTVRTFYGRPRRVRCYFTTNQPSHKAYGYRTIVNTTVQGTAADILKIALVKLWKEHYNNPQIKGDSFFLSTVHDEVNSQVRISNVNNLVADIVRCMKFKIPEFSVQMDVGIEIGHKWGQCFPFHFEEGSLVPTSSIKKFEPSASPAVEVDEFSDFGSSFEAEEE